MPARATPGCDANAPGTVRSMRRIEKVTGRADDMLILRGVNLFPSQIEELVLRDTRLAAALSASLDARAISTK